MKPFFPLKHLLLVSGLLLVLVWISLVPPDLAIPAVDDSSEDALHQLLNIQQEAVRNGNAQKYMDTIDSSNAVYWTEQYHWVEDAVQLPQRSTFSKRLSGRMIEERPDERIAWVEQTYADAAGNMRHAKMPLVFRMQDGQWKDADMRFFQMQGSAVTVKYTHERLEKLAGDLIQQSGNTVHSFYQIYGWEPETEVEMKLYGKKEWFRQSVKLSLPDWAAGWNEYGESIKFDASHPGMNDFLRNATIHETTHKMLGEMTNDNAAYWFQEGMAEHYQQRWSATLENKPTSLPKDKLWPPFIFFSLNLEQLPTEQASVYYVESRMLVDYLIKQYGETTIRSIMQELKKEHYIAKTTSEKLDILQQRTEKAFEKVTGQPFERIVEDWWKSLQV